MNIEEMTMEQIEARLGEVRTLLESDEACNLEELEEEVRSLKARKEEIESRKALVDEVNNGAGKIVESFKEETREMEKIYDARSMEYKNAWLKKLAVDGNGKQMFGALTEEEERAYTMTTVNTSAVVPTMIINRVADLLDNDAPIYNDASKMSVVYGAELPRVKAIVAGDATVTTEGVANADEQDTIDALPLVSKEIKKHIRMSRQMQFQSIDAFEDWVVSHLAKRIAVAKENYILTQFADSTYGIASANEVVGFTDAKIREALGLIHGAGQRVVYANSKTIWNELAGISNTHGDKLFIPSTMDDPTVDGRVYGCLVRRDENIPDDTMYIGIPSKILCNNAIEFDITPQIATDGSLARLFVGYSLFACGLEDPRAFVKMTKTSG